MKTIQNNNFELVDFRTHAGEREINAIASVNDLDNSDSYLASDSPWLQPKKHKKHFIRRRLRC
jgi:hypothetical protein